MLRKLFDKLRGRRSGAHHRAADIADKEREHKLEVERDATSMTGPRF